MDDASGPLVEAASAIVDDVHACYRAVASHDARFDGRFFVAVRTTRVYCRPVCRVRLPRFENCRFFASAAAAEGQGYRPCLRCRPELAPRWATIDGSGQLARAAAHLIESSLGVGAGLAPVARHLGVSDRHLRRLFEAHFCVSPVAYAQTQRLLLAKRLLTDTSLTVTQVAHAAGFGSVRRLNASMQERYRLVPGDLRRASSKRAVHTLSFLLPVRQPYAWSEMTAFLNARGIAGLEHGSPGHYARVLSIAPVERSAIASPASPMSPAPVTGWLAARLVDEGRVLELTVAQELAPVLAHVLTLARSLFDLDHDPIAVEQTLGALARDHAGLRIPGTGGGFEIAVRAVLGQQITVAAARTLATRFVHAFGARCVFAEQPALTHAFPTPATIADASDESIGTLGITRRRVATLKALARELAEGRMLLDPGAPLESTLAALKALPGIGDWTAQYTAMRALRWPDAFPAADYGVMKALGVATPAQAMRVAEAWRPWRAYAVMHLWASLATNDGAKP